ncbi:MAG: hypothetical protein ACI8QC_003564 [Planctomycetota bacterium]|jgi:hypothetical protein
MDLPATAGSQRLRLPLPGTRVEGQATRGRPRGAGTGWLELVRFADSGLGSLLRARFTHPRSTSLAEREWNLLCHLRGAGISTQEPMAVAWAGTAPLRQRSALVVRALDGFKPAPEVLRALPVSDGRRQALRAMGLFLGRLLRSGVELPALCAEHLQISTAELTKAESSADACGLEQVLGARAKSPPPPVPGMAWRELPEVALTAVEGGRLHPGGLPPKLVARLRSKLSQAAEAAGLSPREILYVMALARR